MVNYGDSPVSDAINELTWRRIVRIVIVYFANPVAKGLSPKTVDGPN
jgi:hypothetical protein